jgi:predicted metal-dependent peptidase
MTTMDCVKCGALHGTGPVMAGDCGCNPMTVAGPTTETETGGRVPPAVADALITRIRRVANGMGWRHPFFLPALANCHYRVGPVGTACVTKCGKITVDPAFADEISDDELAGVLAHEASHLIYGHAERRGNREPKRWNRAADRALNAVLREAKLKLPDGCLYPADHDQELWCAEDLYEVEPEGEGDGGDGGGGDGGDGGDRPRVGQGCGPDPAEGEGQDGDGGEGGDEHTRSDGPDWDQKWRDIRAQCAHAVQGSGSGEALRRLSDPPPTKVKWETILRHSMIQAALAHGRDDTTFQRRNRRSGADGPVFPAYCSYKAQVAVCIDTSGSMGEDAVQDAVANAITIARVCGVKLYLVAHTTRAYYAEWIQPNVQAKKLDEILTESGGTCCAAAYAKIAKCGGKFDALIHMTDGEMRWPEPWKPANCKKLIVALLGVQYKDDVPTGATVIEAECPR